MKSFHFQKKMNGVGDHDVKQNQPNCKNGTMKILSYVDSRGETCMNKRRDNLRRGQRQESKSGWQRGK